LDGITILELGTFFAGPFGATLLTDLGARVIKIEQLDGDPLRWQIPMPEVAGVKALQGKESVALNINTPEGQNLVREIAKGCDVVLQTFRAGVAARVGLDEASLRRVNPHLIYHTATGFGADGPYAHRPAYAPTIGAGSGMARRNVGHSVLESPDLTMDRIKVGAVRMGAASMTMGHADGFSSLGVATGLLLSLVARALGHGAQSVQTTMLATMSHVLSDVMVEYEGRPPFLEPDGGLHGFGACYRLYETARGWVFLAAPSDAEFRRLVTVLGDEALAADQRFATIRDRSRHDAALAEALATTLRRADAETWEARMTKEDVGCVAVAESTSHAIIMDPDGLGRQHGFVTDVTHPVLEEHSRLAPLVTFSRSATRALPAPRTGQHTEAVLREIGVDEARLARLVEAGVVGI
jgi:crotonobetainyl-CoA:carnitine CoA-transferase CaiB-like acyl-CoA transferase